MHNSTSITSLSRSSPRIVLLIASACLSAMACAPAGADSPQAGVQPAPLAAKAPSFDVFEYIVDGNSLLADPVIENTMAPFLGEGKTLADVDGARAALEQVYHEAGYLTVVVSIPEQSVDAGAVALHVVEAGIERLRVKGAEYTLPSDIKARIPELAEGNVPNFNKVQQQLAAFNRNPNVKLTPVLRAGRLPGTVEVQLDAEDQLPVHGSIEYSNRQTPNTTAQRVAASLRYDNLWQRGHSLGLTLQTAPQRSTDARVAALTYVFPVGQDGDAVALSALHSRSEFASLANAPGLGLLGNSDTFGLRYTAPLNTTAEFTHSLALGLDHKKVGQDLLVLGGGGTSAKIAYTPLVGSYTARRFGPQRTTGVDLAVSAGLRGMLGNHDDAFDAKRAGASASFLAVRSSVSHAENLGRWTLSGKLDVQLASGPLLPSEQFTAGGADSVRGYLEGERAADAGLRFGVELRTPQYSPGSAGSDWHLAGLAFFDSARLTVMQAQYPQPEHETLRAVGLGVRLSAPRGVAVEIDAARALVDGDSTRAGAKRVHARAVWGF